MQSKIVPGLFFAGRSWMWMDHRGYNFNMPGPAARSWRRRYRLTSCSGLGGCVLPLAEFGYFCCVPAGSAASSEAAFSKAFPMSIRRRRYIVPSAIWQ